MAKDTSKIRADAIQKMASRLGVDSDAIHASISKCMLKSDLDLNAFSTSLETQIKSLRSRAARSKQRLLDSLGAISKLRARIDMIDRELEARTAGIEECTHMIELMERALLSTSPLGNSGSHRRDN